MREQCQATCRDGSPCSARPRPGTADRPWHAPELADRRAEWSRRGGKGRALEARVRKAMPAALSSDDLLVTLTRVIKRVEDGEVEPGVLTAISEPPEPWRRLRKASEVEELTRRLDELGVLAAGSRLA